ncbi:uncharacterized protein LOC141939827 isoform X3 [Strix uralensis]|uniref:uncharacterized protein LOC141939827 isoform X3 n=1 Tax=Strix uralensis TaxID=36305 RepID=UPI003DA79BF3
MGHLESNAQPSSATQKWPLNTGIPGLLRDSAMALWYLITKVTGPARSLLQCRGLHRITASFRAHPPAPAWGPPRAAGSLTDKRQLLSRQHLSPARLPQVTGEGELGKAARATEPLRCLR